MELVLKVFKAVANQRRLHILRLLMKEGELPVSVVSRKIGISFTSTSKHLLKLENVGLIRRRETKNWVYYSINPDRKYEYWDIVFKFIGKKV